MPIGIVVILILIEIVAGLFDPPVSDDLFRAETRDQGAVAVARFLVAEDGSVEVAAGPGVPVRPLEPAATGWRLTLNTAKGAQGYTVAIPGDIHVVVTGGEPRTYRDADVPITVEIPEGRAATVAVLDSLLQPRYDTVTFDAFKPGNYMDFDHRKPMGPGPGADSFYDRGVLAGEIVMVNGARAVEWEGDGYAWLADCVSVAPDAWRTELGWMNDTGTFCVQTSEGRFGLMEFPSAGPDDPGPIPVYFIWKTR